MEKSVRHTVAMVLTAVYLLVIMAPLAPALLHSPSLAHALTGECSGDCRVCGCAPERSAAHACCCWQKKRIEDRRSVAAKGSSCCTKAPAPSPATTAACCAGRKATLPPATTGGCCTWDKVLAASDGESRPAGQSGETAITAAPCGSGKLLAFAAPEKLQHLPYVFASPPPCQPATPYRPLSGEHLTSLPGEPPDPPPKISSRA
jgi:hypothetical protein